MAMYIWQGGTNQPLTRKFESGPVLWVKEDAQYEVPVKLFDIENGLLPLIDYINAKYDKSGDFFVYRSSMRVNPLWFGNYFLVPARLTFNPSGLMGCDKIKLFFHPDTDEETCFKAWREIERKIKAS